MSDDFQIGDVVVRVAGSERPMAIGAIDRVADIVLVWFDDEPERARGLVLSINDRPLGDGTAWNPFNFRKLPRADEQFTEQMRACRPTRVGEPA